MLLINIISIILVIIVIITITKILIDLNKKVKEKFKKEEEEFLIYKSRLNKLENSDLNKESLKTLDIIAKRFFKEKLNFKKNLTYLELSEEFKKKKDQESAEFCILMSNLLYSGEKITIKDIKVSINLFSDILNKKIRFLFLTKNN